MDFTLAQIEAALDAGKITVRVNNGKFWALRRNGQTQLWKTRPGHFRIPVKAGLRSCGEITQRSVVAAASDSAKCYHGDFVISD